MLFHEFQKIEKQSLAHKSIYIHANIHANIHVSIPAHVNVQQVVTGSLVDCLCLLFLCRLNDELSENSLPHVVQE